MKHIILFFLQPAPFSCLLCSVGELEAEVQRLQDAQWQWRAAASDSADLAACRAQLHALQGEYATFRQVTDASLQSKTGEVCRLISQQEALVRATLTLSK